MGRKSKYSLEVKLLAVQHCLEGKSSVSHYARMLGIRHSILQSWIMNYQSSGIEGITDKKTNSIYTREMKIAAVKDYLAGEGSYSDICKKYRIRAAYQLQSWVLKYNGHKELKDSRAGGTTTMTKGRKTTYDERVEIVEYYISNGMNYAQTAEKHQVSYQQVYQWVKKYETAGERGLSDNRGKRKTEEAMTELEKLRAENKLLLAEKKRAEIEIEFLKKVDEIERRRY